jgi:hypothetical protein
MFLARPGRPVRKASDAWTAPLKRRSPASSGQGQHRSRVGAVPATWGEIFGAAALIDRLARDARMVLDGNCCQRPLPPAHRCRSASVWYARSRPDGDPGLTSAARRP